MNMAKNSNNNSPSTRVITADGTPSSQGPLDITTNATDESITSGISFIITLRCIFIGTTMAVTPIITNTLNMLLPTTLPTASSLLPFTAEKTLMASSGAEVPKATTVSPTTRSDMPIRLAIADAPSVRKLAPPNISTSPTTKNIILRIIRLYFSIIKSAPKLPINSVILNVLFAPPRILRTFATNHCPIYNMKTATMDCIVP